jgi:hypothetical protein
MGALEALNGMTDDCVPVFRALEPLAGHAHDGR